MVVSPPGLPTTETGVPMESVGALGSSAKAGLGVATKKAPSSANTPGTAQTRLIALPWNMLRGPLFGFRSQLAVVALSLRWVVPTPKASRQLPQHTRAGTSSV